MMRSCPSPTTPFRDLPRLAQVNLLLLAGGVVALSARLWPDWRHNPDLSHGLFMPLVFVVLLNEARRSGGCFLRQRGLTALGVAVALALALGALLAAGLYAASVDWSHPLVNCALTAAVVLFLTAGLLVYASDGLRYIPVNWSAAVALGLWLLCTPIPPGTYTRLTLTLQLWISESVLRTLHVFGIAAIRHGNIIELGRATVGVEEACSGIRSLISCVFAGLFFSATLVRRPWARALVIGLAAPVALAMNFVRSFTLTALANAGVSIAGLWHDLTGFAVLGVTAALLAGIAFVLEHQQPAVSATTAARATDRTPRLALGMLSLASATAAMLVFVCVVNTRPSVRQDAPAPDLATVLPAAADGWQVVTTGDLYQFRDTLQTTTLAQRVYRKTGADGQLTEVILYAAYWRPGQAPVSLVASHTPDACWPGSGWTAQPTSPSRRQLSAGNRTLPTAEYRVFTYNGFPQHVWFWHLYDGRPLAYRDPYSAIELLRLAWKYGFRHDGDQLFVRVSSNRPWTELAREPLLAEFFRQTQPLGL